MAEGGIGGECDRERCGEEGENGKNIVLDYITCSSVCLVMNGDRISFFHQDTCTRILPC